MLNLLSPKGNQRFNASLKNNRQVEFDKLMAPEGQISLYSLIPLNKHTDFNVRHFSGTATYKTTFQVERTDKPMFIDMGDVQVIAEIK
tara:strand:+ start:218 stop:481 length:264 start_codon:yes stop_codon:yes gene_type:complete